MKGNKKQRVGCPPKGGQVALCFGRIYSTIIIHFLIENARGEV